MKKILAFSLGLFLILALSSMKSDVIVSAKCADIQCAEEKVTDVTEESWHVGGINIDRNSALVEQEQQIMGVIEVTQTVTETTAETVDETAGSVIPAIGATTTELNSQSDEYIAEDIIPSVAAPKTEMGNVANEASCEEESIPNVGVEEQGTEKEAVGVKRAIVLA